MASKIFYVFLIIFVIVPSTFSHSSIKPSKTIVIASSSSVFIADTAEHYDCNKNYTESSMRIFSPNYPASLSNNTECTWNIKLPAGQRVLFNIELFSPGTNQNCSSMYLEIYDGAQHSPLIDTYCGHIFQESIISTGNKMFVRFVLNEINDVTNVTTNENGGSNIYRLSYKSYKEASPLSISIHTKDPKNNKTELSSLSSPLYPNKYPHNLNQTWILQAPAGYQVSLLFKKFLLEDSDGCVSDYLEIKDPMIPNSASKYCGYRLGDWIQSEGETIVLTMKTDAKISASGFLIEYKAVSSSCNKTYTNETGVFTYQPGSPTCFWKVNVPFGYEILLTFDRFFFGVSEDCSGTSLSIRDGLSESSPLIEKFCNLQNGEKIKSSSNELFISYEVLDIHGGMGFEIAYKAVEAECQNVYLNDTEGLISSPNYPSSYNSNSNCSWLIELDPQNIISLTFEKIDIEFSIGCLNDYVLIYDGPSAGSELLGRFCGDSADSVLSSGSSVFVEFVSNGYLTRQGFRLSYSAINTTTACSVDKTVALTEPNGVIVSTNYPEIYPNNHDCSWLITSNPGYQIHVVFEYFELEKDDLCQHDYVAFYSNFNDTDYAARIVKHCGYIRRWDIEPIVSEAEVMFIRFHSNSQKTRKGFIIKYEAKETGTPVPTSDVLEEESHQAVQFTLENVELHRWEMEMYDNFREAMALAANNYCALNKEPECKLSQRSRRSVSSQEFENDNVYILPDYPEVTNENKDLVVAFYMTYPDGASNLKFVPHPVVVAILKTYQSDIEEAVESNFSNIKAHSPYEEPYPIPTEDNTGAIVAIVIVMFIILVLVGLFVFWKFYLSKRSTKVDVVVESKRKLSQWHIQRFKNESTRKRSKSDPKMYKMLEFENHSDA